MWKKFPYHNKKEFFGEFLIKIKSIKLMIIKNYKELKLTNLSVLYQKLNPNL